MSGLLGLPTEVLELIIDAVLPQCWTFTQDTRDWLQMKLVCSKFQLLSVCILLTSMAHILV